MEFNSVLIASVFMLLAAGLSLAGKTQKKHVLSTEKEAYACGEIAGSWDGAEDTIYARLYKTMGLKRLDALHNDDLNEYAIWMFASVAIVLSLFLLWGA